VEGPYLVNETTFKLINILQQTFDAIFVAEMAVEKYPVQFYVKPSLKTGYQRTGTGTANLMHGIKSTKKLGRPSEHLETWLHTSKPDTIRFLVGVQKDNRRIYVELRGEDGKLLTRNPVSLGRNLRDEHADPEGSAADKLCAEVVAIDKLAEIKVKLQHGLPIGREATKKHLFGTYIDAAVWDAHKQAAEHGLLAPGPYRDSLIGDLTMSKSAHEVRYTGKRGAKLRRRTNRRGLSEAQAKQIAAAIAAGKDPDKSRTFLQRANQIAALKPRWGDVPTIEITEEALNEWVKNDLRIRRGPNKGQAYTNTSLNNIDNAFAHAWRKAVEAGAVPKNLKRPGILYRGKEALGRKSVERSFFRAGEIKDLADYLIARWDGADFPTKLQYLYVGLLIRTGIRTGNELLALKIDYYQPAMQFDPALGRPRMTYNLEIPPNAGKYEKGRTVAIDQSKDLFFPVIAWIEEVIAIWKTMLPPEKVRNAHLFGPPRRRRADDYRNATIALFKAVGIRVDARTGQNRVPYAARHFFGTTVIDTRGRDVSLYALAKWMGTSEKMLREHYDRNIQALQALKIDGYRED
jgi:integrase